MYLVKCMKCGFKIEDPKKIVFYFGSEAFDPSLLQGSLVEKKRKLANLLNSRKMECPKCKATGEWTWL